MKKTVKIIAILLVLVMVVGALASCSKMLFGTYKGELGLGSLLGAKASYVFSGSNVTLVVTTTILGSSNSKEYKGTYEIAKAADGTESITFTFEDSDASSYSGTQTFAQGTDDAGNDTVIIGGLTYTKTK